MKKGKSKVSLFESIEITDKDYAEKLYAKECKKIKLKGICTIIATIGTACSLVAFGDVVSKQSILYNLIGFVWLLGIVAAMIAGPFLNFFKVILKCGQIGYYIVPFILLDILGFVFGLAIGLIIAFVLPIIPSIIALYQSWKNLKYTKDYLATVHSQINNEYKEEI